MADAVSICNLALSHLGDTASVASIDPPEESAQAKMCAIFYPQAVNTVLDMHDWAFAKTRALLAEVANAETYGWKHAFRKPSDCLHAISIEDYRTLDHLEPRRIRTPFFLDRLSEKAEFLLEGKTIYTNVAYPVLSYITANVRASEYPPGFVLALSYYLANLIAGARIKGKEGIQIAASMQEQFSRALAAAKTRDSAQRQDRIQFVPTWIQAR